MSAIIATHDFDPAAPEAAHEFLKRARWDLRQLRKVHVHRSHIHIIDVNGDRLEVRGVGWPDEATVTLLRLVNTAFDAETLPNPTEAEYKEYFTGRCRTWAQDRVM
jgi:hypothetical protein